MNSLTLILVVTNQVQRVYLLQPHLRVGAITRGADVDAPQPESRGQLTQ